MKYTEGLNEPQRQAVMHGDGPMLILAGAGSGKTKVLTHRIARLVDEAGVHPANIIAITFTNKAAREMQSRVQHLLGIDSSSLWISTFHSACVRILRKDIDRLGYNKNFVIYDTGDQVTLIKDCLADLKLNDKNFPPKSVIEQISKAKNELIEPHAFTTMYASDFRMSKIAVIYDLYQKKIKANNAVDFDDLIMLTIKLFQKNPDVLEFYTKKFQYVMVDEYQDTNTSQYTFVSLISSGKNNLCVVGDDDQSIYGWRGANIRNILDFEDDFKGCKVVKLEQNYRSTSNILDAANNVIGQNTGRKPKKLWTEETGGNKPVVYKASDQHDESTFVAKEIICQVAKGRSYSDFAILYRTNAQSRTFEEQLVREGIPYKIFGGIKFYDRKEIKDVCAYLKVIMNPADNIGLKRIINSPKRGIGESTVATIEKVASINGISAFEAINISEKIPDLTRTSAKLKDFAAIITKLRAYAESMTVTELFDEVLKESGLVLELEKENSIEARTRIENINELKSVAIDFEKAADEQGTEKSLESFLSQISLVSDIDSMQEGASQVVLMTLHSAKGLEFPVVFMAGMDEGLFPGVRSFASEDDIEEERRLCYVGITRAREQIFLITAFSRTIFGKTERYVQSRFINEIPSELVEIKNGGYRGFGMGIPTGLSGGGQRVSSKSKQSTFQKTDEPPIMQVQRGFQIDENVQSFKSGETVMHKKFGKGKIAKVDGAGKEQKLEIEFENVGMRRLMAAYAQLEKS
ncbi:MAG: DNA helicase PcrA [Bacillota bacterium]